MENDFFIWRGTQDGRELLFKGLSREECDDIVEEALYNSPKATKPYGIGHGSASDMWDYYFAETLGVCSYDRTKFTFEEKVAYALTKFYIENGGEVGFEQCYQSDDVMATFSCEGIKFTAIGTVQGKSYKGNEYVGNAGTVHYEGFSCSGFDMKTLTAEIDDEVYDAMDIDTDLDAFEAVGDILNNIAQDALSGENQY